MAKTTLLVDNHSLYEAALEGLELQKQRLEEQIRQVRAVLGGRRVTAAKPEPAPEEAAAPKKRRGRKPGVKVAGKKRKRTLSPEARLRIAAAQKKRWENFRTTTQGS